MKLIPVVEEVRSILESNKVARDNDNYLISKVWSNALRAKGYSIKEMTVLDFFKVYSFGNVLPHHESIRRTRQKLQEQDPSLRGLWYKNKKGEGEEETRRELKNI